MRRVSPFLHLTALVLLPLALACRSDGEAGGAAPNPGTDPDPVPASDIVLRVNPERVEAGGSVELVLRNGSDGDIGYNLCTSQLQRRTEDGWVPVPSERVCTMELRTLPPGERASFTLEIPADLAEGRYRATTTVERMASGTREAVVSEPFRVT